MKITASKKLDISYFKINNVPSIWHETEKLFLDGNLGKISDNVKL